MYPDKLQDIHRWEVGDGYVNCGSSADWLNFHGDENENEGGVGELDLHPGVSCPTEDADCVPKYGATFPLHCTRDEGNNATFMADLPIVLTLTYFGDYVYPTL